MSKLRAQIEAATASMRQVAQQVQKAIQPSLEFVEHVRREQDRVRRELKRTTSSLRTVIDTYAAMPAPMRAFAAEMAERDRKLRDLVVEVFEPLRKRAEAEERAKVRRELAVTTPVVVTARRRERRLPRRLASVGDDGGGGDEAAHGELALHADDLPDEQVVVVQDAGPDQAHVQAHAGAAGRCA